MLPLAASPVVTAVPLWTDRVSALSAALAAIAAAVTVWIAVKAAFYARDQVKGARDQLVEAKALRKEQAQPYVVVYAEPAAGGNYFIDIVVRNFGLTGAHDVRIDCHPGLQRSGEPGEPQDMFIPGLPFLAPGQEWRTFWDSGFQRLEQDLPLRYELTAHYTDKGGEDLDTPSVLDWAIFRQRLWAEEKTISDIGLAADKIAKTLQAMESSTKVTKVATYDGPAFDATRAAARARHDRMVDRYEERQKRAAEPPDEAQPSADGWRETSLWF